MSKSKTAHFWAEDETLFMLYQLRELNILNYMDGRKTRNGNLFKKAAKRLDNAGFKRTPEQIRIKWKHTKKTYYSARRNPQTSVDNTVICPGPYSNILEELLGRRPLSQAVENGVESVQGARDLDDAPRTAQEPLEDQDSPDETFTPVISPVTRVSDVERRSRSMGTQSGVRSKAQQKKRLREKPGSFRPSSVQFIQEGEFDDLDEDNEEEEYETDVSLDQDMGSSPENADPIYCPNQPRVTEVMSLSRPQHQENSTDRAAAPPNASRHGVLEQFAEVMLADMRRIKDPIVLMRLRRDITDLVFRAVEEEERGKRMEVCEKLQPVRMSRSQACSQPVQEGAALQGTTELNIQVPQIKRETD